MLISGSLFLFFKVYQSFHPPHFAFGCLFTFFPVAATLIPILEGRFLNVIYNFDYLLLRLPDYIYPHISHGRIHMDPNKRGHYLSSTIRTKVLEYSYLV